LPVDVVPQQVRDRAHEAGCVSTHRPIVARGFRAVGLVIGLPSVVLFVVLAAATLTLRLPPLDTSGPLDIGTYGLVALLVAGARGISSAFGFLIKAMDWAIALMAVVSLAVAVLGLFLFVVGRGLQRRAAWARVLGVLTLVSCLAVTLGALSILPHGLLTFDWLLIGVTLYSLWALVRRYA
jgi:hypothetical protein